MKYYEAIGRHAEAYPDHLMLWEPDRVFCFEHDTWIRRRRKGTWMRRLAAMMGLTL